MIRLFLAALFAFGLALAPAGAAYASAGSDMSMPECTKDARSSGQGMPGMPSSGGKNHGKFSCCTPLCHMSAPVAVASHMGAATEISGLSVQFTVTSIELPTFLAAAGLDPPPRT